MNPGVAAAIGVIAGLLAGLGIGAFLLRRFRAGERADPPEPVVMAEQPGIEASTAQLLSLLGSAVVVLGPRDEVVLANAQARSHGLVRSDRVGARELLEQVDRVRVERRARMLDLTVGTRAAISVLSAQVAPLTDELVVVLAEDRTAENRVDETRRDFVANVSHELKTPIGAVSLLAEALEGSSDDPEAVRRFAGRLAVESRRLNQLVGQIIELSRLQADDPLLSPEVVDVDRVLSTAIDMSRVEADGRRVTLTLAGPGGLRVLGSARELTTAVANLVDNAVVYSDAGARVVVAARPESSAGEQFVDITVSDNGIGIAQADLDRIFERFYRVDYARSRDNGGTGLGLAIVKHVVAAHRGEVSVWSQPGRGSTFTVRIPAHAGHDRAGPESRTSGPVDQPVGQPVDVNHEPQEIIR